MDFTTPCLSSILSLFLSFDSSNSLAPRAFIFSSAELVQFLLQICKLNLRGRRKEAGIRKVLLFFPPRGTDGNFFFDDGNGLDWRLGGSLLPLCIWSDQCTDYFVVSCEKCLPGGYRQSVKLVARLKILSQAVA